MLVPAPPEQVVVVTAPAWDSQRAIFRRFEWRDGYWARQGRPVKAWVGANGFAPWRTRLQNTGKTPAGTFAITAAFGRGSGRGVDLPYQQITQETYWPYDPRDPRTYNVLQTTRVPGARWRDDGQWSERLVDYGAAYRYAAVLDYNLPTSTYVAANGERRSDEQADPTKGGGIFLHVSQGRPTAGCVAIPSKQMAATLRWLRAKAHPVIVMGPRPVTRGWRQATGSRAVAQVQPLNARNPW